jgi:hypothetical protein
MAQADPAIIARAFTDLGAQIPLISNHPTVQTLDQAQNFQEEVRGQFRRHDEQFTQLQRTLDGVERGLEEMRREFRLSLNQISREFVPSHTHITIGIGGLIRNTVKHCFHYVYTTHLVETKHISATQLECKLRRSPGTTY